MSVKRDGREERKTEERSLATVLEMLTPGVDGKEESGEDRKGLKQQSLQKSLLFTALLTGFALLPRLECSGTITAYCSLDLLGSSDLPTLASQSAEITVMSHHTQLEIFFKLLKIWRDV
ncbi:Protein PPP5D1 [Plecturocebus cupreus]